MKKKMIFSVFLLIMVCFANILPPTVLQAGAIEVGEILTDKVDFSSSAKSAIMIESTTGRILYEKNKSEKLPMASTTKIVTAITAIENAKDLDTPFEIDSRAVGISGTSIYLQPKEKLSLRELLYGLMLRSGNDASVAIAYAVGGSIDNFCELMNQTAKKAGANDSSFKNPHGLDEKGHYTTAFDLAKITAYALENETFKEIVSTKTKTICEDQDNKRYLVNKNKLLAKMDGCIGVKTGFTDDAGRCLVSACERDGLRLISVVFNCGPMFEESEALLEKGFEKFSMIEILPAYHYVDSVTLDNGEKASVGLYSLRSFSLPLSEREQSNLNVVFDVPNHLSAPIKKDQEVGNVQIYYDKHLIFEEKIYTIEEVDSKLLKDKIKEILDRWNA